MDVVLRVRGVLWEVYPRTWCDEGGRALVFFVGTSSERGWEKYRLHPQYVLRGSPRTRCCRLEKLRVLEPDYHLWPMSVMLGKNAPP